MKDIKFLASPQSFSSDTAFVAHLSDINSKEGLFKQFSDRLEMPDYFAHNWDALSDCLRDFHWIEKQSLNYQHICRYFLKLFLTGRREKNIALICVSRERQRFSASV